MCNKTPLPAKEVVAALGGPAAVARDVLKGAITSQAVTQWSHVPSAWAPTIEAWAREHGKFIGERPILCEDMVPAIDWDLIRGTSKGYANDSEIV